MILTKYSLCYIVDIFLQSVPLPSINSLRLLDFTFDDEAVGDQETLLGTLAMVMDLKLHEHFNVEYQVCRIKCGLRWLWCHSFLYIFCLGKQPTFNKVTTGLPVKWRLRNNEPRNSTRMTCHWVYFWLFVPQGKFTSTNQIYDPDLGSDTSSVWIFCAHSSDVILWGNKWSDPQNFSG